MFKHFGICLTCRTPTPDIVRDARIADDCGLGSIWVNESSYYRAAVSTMMAIAANTRQVQVGTGVASVFSRHPAALAMEAATIDEFSDRRFVLGIGATPFTPRETGPSRVSPVRAMRECTEIVRGLLARKLVDYQGEVFTMVESDHHSEWKTSLNFIPPRVELPIYFGVGGPKLLELAGRLADGVILTNPCTLRYLEHALVHVRRGAEAAGRSLSELTICGFQTFAVAERTEQAKEAVKEMLAAYVAHVGGKHGEALGISEQEFRSFDDALHKQGVKAAVKLVTDELIERLAITGTPEECVRKLTPFIRAGLNVPIAFHTPGPDRRRAFELIGREIVPALQKIVV
ncbi:MAG: LLM class flavin-dependent oxidoreductase [Deltaproteobacteria bacterium]|nr:LLM class flavin-dependent oxidoreductase [Deltaproteobacteria bacterium]